MEIAISKNIRRYRKEMGLTQEQLAEAVGVTVGAVSKWESGLSIPDVSLIVELADFFETSVDALLGYNWRKTNMGKAAEEIMNLRISKNFVQGTVEAEKYLIKYPNCFDVVYQSGGLYHMKGVEQGDKEALNKALTLYKRACALIDQNIDENISEITIQNTIGSIYMSLGNTEKAIEQLKKYNYAGINNGEIGFFLIMSEKYDEALPYLSQGFFLYIVGLFQTVIAYLTYFVEKKEFIQALEIVQWMHEIIKGLKQIDKVSYIDKMDVMLLTCWSMIYGYMGEFNHAKEYLKKSKELAKKFDIAPDFSINNIKYFYGKNDALADNFGATATEGIIKTIHINKDIKKELMAIWEELEVEDKERGFTT